MAPDNAESDSDSLTLGDPEEQEPASSPLRVSQNTQFESGIPPARARAEFEPRVGSELELPLDGGGQRVEQALANALRTEANLSVLARGIKQLSSSAQSAHAANLELMHELDELRVHLARGYEEEQALRYRMHQLEQLVDVIRHETSRERTFLIEQQDAFLVEILTDHERQLDALRQRLRESSQSKADPRAHEELLAQRDQAREYATRCERERDLAWQELAAATAAPTERVPRSPSGSAAIGSISLRSVAVPASAVDHERPTPRPATRYSLSGEDLDE